MNIDPLLIDLYPGDRRVDWAAFIAAGPPWHGAILKISQGLRYEYAAWVDKQRRAIAASPRYGIDLFDGLYHFLDLAADGARQAEWCWQICGNVGGERPGTLPLMLDVERGGQADTNPSPALVRGTTRAFAERYHELSGRRATLYGGELLRASGVTDMLECGRSAVALYAPELHSRGETTAQFLARTGTSVRDTMLWQYTAAEGTATGPTGYPRESPGVGRVDISAVILPGGLDALRSLAGAAQ